MCRATFGRVALLLGWAATVVGIVATHDAVHAAQVDLTIRADRIDRSPITVQVSSGDTIKWTSTPQTPGAARFQIVVKAVDGNPFVGGGFESAKVAIGGNVVSPAVAEDAGRAEPNIYSYEIRLFNGAGDEIEARREKRNFIWVPGGRDGFVNVRGLFACGPANPGEKDVFCNDADHLRDVIDDDVVTYGNNWDRRPRVLRSPSLRALVDNITGRDERPGAPRIVSAFVDADDDDISVLWVGGHGGTVADGDETADTFIRLGDDIRDDAFGPEGEIGKALTRIRGTKLIIFVACRSGGMFDGKGDAPIANSILISSNDSRNCSNLSVGNPADPTVVPRVFGHAHSYFGGSLVSGFTRVDPYGPDRLPAVGVVAADPHPQEATQETRSITIGRWFEFASDQVREIRASPKVTFPFAETPQIEDGFAPAGRKPGDLVIFRYRRGIIKDHAHPDPPGTEAAISGCPECQCPGGACAVPPIVTSATGSASRVGAVPSSGQVGGAQVRIAMRFTLSETVDLAASPLTITRLLDETDGVGELVKGTGGADLLPLTLRARQGGTRTAAIFETSPEARPRVQARVQARGDGVFDLVVNVDRATIPVFPRQCAGERPARTDLLTSLALEDGGSLPLVVTTAQSWRCLDLLGGDVEKPRSLKLP